jgi:type I restriction-modification system DNA methylase subunit
MTHSTQPHDVSRLIWAVVDLLRDTYSRSDYEQVILPFTLLRRLDCEGALALDRRAATRDAALRVSELSSQEARARPRKRGVPQ